MKVRNLLSLLAFAPLFVGTSAIAESSPKVSEQEKDAVPEAISRDDWQLTLSFPIWIAGLGGQLTVNGQEFNPDQDTGDAIDILETHLNMAAVGHFEAEKSRFGGIVDAMYVDLRSTGNGNNFDSDAEAFIKGFIGEVDGFYTVIAPDPTKVGFGRVRVDALAGLRVSSVKIGIDSDALDVSSNTVTLYDPIVGGRLEVGLLKWLSFKLRGDVGGFGISEWKTSEPVWNVETGLDFRLASWFDLGVGYRWLKYNFVADDNDSKFDATISGPVVTLEFSF